MKRYVIEARTETTTVFTENTGGEWVRASEYITLQEAYDKAQTTLADVEQKYAAVLEELATLKEAAAE